MVSVIKKIINANNMKKRYKKVGTTINSINIANSVKLGKSCLINRRVILEDNVEVGDFTYFNSNKYWITVESNVKIGKYCSIAPGVHIGAGNHEYKYVTTHPVLFDKYYEKKLNMPANTQKVNGLKDKDANTIIGNDVWIGLGAIIKRGVKIGNGAIIAAGSIVVKDVPDYAIVGGNPAKIIKYRTTEDNIKYFMENESKMWWNWNREEIVKNIEKLYDFDEYIGLLKEKESEYKK